MTVSISTGVSGCDVFVEMMDDVSPSDDTDPLLLISLDAVDHP